MARSGRNADDGRFGAVSRLRAAPGPTPIDSPLRVVLALAMNVPTVLKVGWYEPLLNEAALFWGQVAMLAVYGVSLFLSARALGAEPARRRDFLSVTRPEQVATVLGLLTCFWDPGPKIFAAALLMFHLTRLYLRLVQTRVPAGLVFLGSFVVLTLVGAAALTLPAATPRDRPIDFVDALFTMSSAISQTGLIVRDTGTGFTRFGQVIILIWIQVGALGVIVFGALLVSVIGSSFGLRATQTLAEGTEQGWSGQLSLQKLVTFIIIFTHAVELVGAVALFVGWPESWEGMPHDMETIGDRAYHAVYFSVSAFCNAGFVTTEGSMAGLRLHWTTHAIVGGLIVLGSIGFPVLDNIRRVAWARIRGVRSEGGRLVRVDLNAKILLASTLAAYIVGGAIVFASVLALSDEPPAVALADAHFMSVNRTAGFSSMQTQELSPLAQLGFIALMAIGGSPGSVAGGIKLMAVAVVLLTVFATLRGRAVTTVFGRTIPDPLVRKCATLTVLWLLTLAFLTAIITVTERDSGHTLKELLFETTSALATCGLSLNLTEGMTDAGKLVMSAAMFIGRVGPFAVLAALFSVAKFRRARYEYPAEDVVIY